MHTRRCNVGFAHGDVLYRRDGKLRLPRTAAHLWPFSRALVATLDLVGIADELSADIDADAAVAASLKRSTATGTRAATRRRTHRTFAARVSAEIAITTTTHGSASRWSSSSACAWDPAILTEPRSYFASRPVVDGTGVPCQTQAVCSGSSRAVERAP